MKHLIGLAGACLSAALLTACGAPGNGVASSVPFSPHSSATANRVAEATVWQLFSFRGKSGELPYAGLTALNGTLYGTATAGGDKQLGVVFRITPTGEEKLLHAFRGGSDGAYPYGSLNDVRGSLYGTTVGGGADGAGTVFKIVPSGSESIVYNFKGGSDGAGPMARLTEVRGVLYGTTQGGGAHNCGTVFRVTLSGKEAVLHSFACGRDGASPEGELANVDGVLYGTTYGIQAKGNDGTVFKITTEGAETVLHRFKGGPSDGANPASGLVNDGGTLYGTTLLGGNGCYSGGGECGTVYKITTTGAETVIHAFSGGYQDGANPYASLANIDGELYGTTESGYDGCYYNYGCGVVFKITTSGIETIVASFGNGGGTNPESHVTNVNGTLYGTASKGGAANTGTVYAISP